MSSFSDVIVWRGIERLVVVSGGILFAYLGFLLYKLGFSAGPGKLSAKTPLLQFALSGTGPGLFFMAFGALVLVIALFQRGSQLDLGQKHGVPLTASVATNSATMEELLLRYQDLFPAHIADPTTLSNVHTMMKALSNRWQTTTDGDNSK